MTAVGTEAVLVGWFSEEKCNNKSVPGTIGVIIVNFEICLRVLRNFNLYKNKQLCGLAKNLNQKAIPVINLMNLIILNLKKLIF